MRTFSRQDIKMKKQRLHWINHHIQQEELSIKKNRIKRIIEELKEKGGIHGPSFWEMRRKFLGRKKEIPYAIEDEEGRLLENEEEILERYASYYRDLLSTPSARSEEERQIEGEIEDLFEAVQAKSKIQEPKEISREEILTSIKLLKRKKAPDRQRWRGEWIIEGGDEMISSVKILFERIQKEHKIPRQWNYITIKSIHKKGPKKDLENQRGIFLANILYKTFERVILARNKKDIENMLSEFQCGGRKGMSSVDNIMALSGMIERNRSLGRNTYLFFGDARKCFDKLWLKDCLIQLQKGGMREHDISLLYQLNKEATINVDTPHGLTKDFHISEAVKQGTISGPMLCGVEMDRVNQSENRVKASYGPNYEMGMPGFVDDLSAGGDREDVISAINCCKELEKRKVTYNIDKTVYMIIRTGQGLPEKITEMTREGIIPEAELHQYVGIWVNEKGTLSNHIVEMEKKANIITREIKKLGMENVIGGEALRARVKLYEATMIQAILFNLEGWGGLLPEEVDKFEGIQCKSLKELLNLPKSTSHLGVLWEVGCWPMRERIQYKQLMLFHNILHSPETRLARRILQQQKEFKMQRCLQSSVDRIAEQIEIDCSWESVKKMPKSSFKRIVKQKLKEEIFKRMKQSSQDKTKLRFIKKEVFERSAYIDKAHSVLSYQILKTRLNMQDLSSNFGSKDKCSLCLLEEESTEHVLICKGVELEEISPRWLSNTSNMEIWARICQRIQLFIEKKTLISDTM